MSAPRKERKVVTVLFADLVGFTARAETLDPEDVEAILGPYHARLRGELERFGGTVEKFIGDAVMALFGAPVAHEDDPERAVRAALAIRDWARESSDVQVRVAVNTGEALVNLAARSELGEGMAAGDVVNTTARLQSAAPVNGVLVGETTYRATRHVIEYADAEPVEAKGKAVPIPVWEAQAPRARVGTEAVSRRAPLVGRERERDQLVDAFERARQEQSAQFVTLVGVPGIGKSRLVSELLDYVEALPELVYWRHGRSLPYGEGVTFWALAEMVKAQAGIVENDARGEVERKLRDAVAEVVPEAERPWVEASLRPLLGLDPVSDTAVDGRDRVPAWRRFLEALADQHPLVLVFEDLHWADDELLEFVDELPEWSEDVPMLVLATARPELLTRRPGWGGGKRNALTISLSALAPDDTARLIAALLERTVLPAETQAALLERAGGNPLYAEQFVRMLSERGELGGDLPENVQSIIAARLDALPDDEKALLQDAAVVGKVFWTGSLAAVNDTEPSTIEQHLRSLARKDFVRRERRTSVDDESEYSFNHILVQDVAYSQIPRGARAAKHRRAGEWIESLGREADQAELLAHHYGRALELLQAAGADVGELPFRARAALRAAGTRALSLTAYAAAVRWFEAAGAIDAQPDPERPQALLHHALALHALLDPARFDVLGEARDALVAVGDVERAAEATVALAEAWWWAGDHARCVDFVDRASALVRDGTELVRALVLSQIARFRSLFGDNLGAVETALESLRLSEAVGRDDLRSKNLITLGTARTYLPEADRGAAANEIRAGIDLARAGGYFDQLSRGITNLGSNLSLVGDLEGAYACVVEAHELAQLRGHYGGIRFCEGNLIDLALTRGDWQDAERRATAFLDESERGAHMLDTIALEVRAIICLARDDANLAVEHAERAVASARKVRDPQAVIPALGTAALIHAELEQPDRAKELLAEIEPGAHIASVPAPMFAAVRLGVHEDWRRRIAPGRLGTRWDEAADAVLDERWQDAAVAYAAIGARPYAALAALRGAAECVAAGDRASADRLLAQALAFFRSVGATRYVREGEQLLAATA